MKSTAIGLAAESAVASLLEQYGHQIMSRNWKNKVCEIDIVSQKDQIVYFTEVKYRSGSAQGSGFEYIANQKLRRLHFAAKIWVSQHKWNGDYRLLAAAVTGLGFEDIELLELE